MKEKLVEEWLIRARERGGIDQAYGQFLISEGHEILWLGHSRTEFGKDIISVDPDGQFHAFQLKDEDIDLKEFRKIQPQIIELVEVPPVHPRIPAGSLHQAHLITSGLFKEEVSLQVRALNEAWVARDRSTLTIMGRDGLIPRFVRMSDVFWPERPNHLRDFFGFYLAEGRGDFDPAKFSEVLKGLLSLEEESTRRKTQRLASIGLLANYLLNPFEREGDHWSLFRGWTMIAAHQAWFAEATELPEKAWRPSFNLAKEAAKERLGTLSTECLEPKGFMPRETEFDDYTRARNLVLAGALAAHSLIRGEQSGAIEAAVRERIEMLLSKGRLYIWGESAIPHLLAIQWYCESRTLCIDALPAIKAAVCAICERNHPRSEDDFFPPPLTSPDDVLAELFSSDSSSQVNRRAPGTWSLQPMMDFLVRRDDRAFLQESWRRISRLDMLSFEPNPTVDSLLWKCPQGHEAVRKPDATQSWSALKRAAKADRSAMLPHVLRDDRDFVLMFMLAYPHRLCRALVRQIDAAYRV